MYHCIERFLSALRKILRRFWDFGATPKFARFAYAKAMPLEIQMREQMLLNVLLKFRIFLLKLCQSNWTLRNSNHSVVRDDKIRNFNSTDVSFDCKHRKGVNFLWRPFERVCRIIKRYTISSVALSYVVLTSRHPSLLASLKCRDVSAKAVSQYCQPDSFPVSAPSNRSVKNTLHIRSKIFLEYSIHTCVMMSFDLRLNENKKEKKRKRNHDNSVRQPRYSRDLGEMNP